MEKQSYIGYHATSKQNSKKIFKYNFKFCTNGWFGTGVYFYLLFNILSIYCLSNQKHFLTCSPPCGNGYVSSDVPACGLT